MDNYPSMLLVLSCFSHVWLCATPWTAAHQAPQSLGFSRQEHWSGLPFPPPMHESEKWKWSHSVVSDSSRPHGLQPTGPLCPWIFQAKVLELRSTSGGKRGSENKSVVVRMSLSFAYKCCSQKPLIRCLCFKAFILKSWLCNLLPIAWGKLPPQ